MEAIRRKPWLWVGPFVVVLLLVFSSLCLWRKESSVTTQEGLDEFDKQRIEIRIKSAEKGIDLATALIGATAILLFAGGAKRAPDKEGAESTSAQPGALLCLLEIAVVLQAFSISCGWLEYSIICSVLESHGYQKTPQEVFAALGQYMSLILGALLYGAYAILQLEAREA